jgi:hypothetical protein
VKEVLHGLRRLLFRAPSALYHCQFGWLLGHRFLLLTRRGRKTERVRQTVLESPALRSGYWGERGRLSLGFAGRLVQEIQASPALQIRVGRECYIPAQHFLSSDQAATFYAEWEHQHPIEARILPKILGIPNDGSESAHQDLSAAIWLVSFRPRVMLANS